MNWNRIESNWKDCVCVYNNKNNNYVSIYCIWVGLDNSNITQKQVIKRILKLTGAETMKYLTKNILNIVKKC